MHVAVSFTGGTVLTDNMPFVTFRFSEEDLNEIKRKVNTSVT